MSKLLKVPRKGRRVIPILLAAGIAVVLGAGAASAFSSGGVVSAVSLLSSGSAASSASAGGAAAAAAPAFQLPFPCGQKWRLNHWAHAPAIDMVKEPNQVGTEGATLVAPAAGTVNMSFYHSNAGNVIQINHGGRHFTTYLHLQSRAVGKGAKVSQGTVIGKVGKTGPTSNGHPHLHYEQGYDRNGNGSATWGYAGAERVTATFNGVSYGGSGREWRNVASKNKCGGGSTPDKYWVDTYVLAAGRKTPGGEQSGVLYKGTHYVFCKKKGPTVRIGRNHNHWWLRTDLDKVQPGKSGRNQYVSAIYLTRWGNNEAKDNSGRTIRTC